MKQEMRHEIRHEIRQVPKLVLRLIQAPKLELQHIITQELQENLMLDVADEEELEIEEMPEIEIKLLGEEEEEKEKEIIEFIRDEIPKYYLPSWEEREEFERAQAVKLPDLKEHLLTQLHITFSGKKELKIGEFIIESLTDEGYFTLSSEEVAKILKVDKKDVEKVLFQIKKFDPPGIGARDAREAILIQMEEKGMDDIAKKIVEKYYNAEKGVIMKELGIDEKTLEGILSEIKKLNPTPASGKWGNITYVIPDALVEKQKGEWKVIIDEKEIPCLKLSSRYIDMLQDESLPKDTRKFLKEKLRRAIRFLKLLEERRKLIRRVIEFIVKYQEDFLEDRSPYLKPLKLKDIAYECNVDISTVYRVLKGRYIQTPKGVFELRYFLTAGIKKGFGMVSKEEVMERIKSIIEKEVRPLSDGEIAEILRREGYKIARRTVAKYREKMGIPPKNKRKRC